jgi:branched-chain amino acid transport system substrate-binding protein
MRGIKPLKGLGCCAVVIASLAVAACGSSDSSSTSTQAPATGDTATTGGASTSSATSTGAAKGEPIKIGAAIAQTGPLSGYDTPATVAANLAVEDINKAGGVLGRPLEIITADTGTDKEKGVSAAQDLIGKGAEVGMVTCDLDFGAPAAVTFASKQLVSMSLCAGSPNFGPKGVSPFAFSAGVATPNEAAGGAEWAYKEKGWKSTYTLVDTTIDYDTSWMDAFQESYKKLGGQIVGSDTFQNGDASIQGQISKIKALKTQPDFLTVCSYQPGGPAAVRQIRAAGIKLPLLLCVGMDGTNWLPSVKGLSDAYVTDYANYLGEDSDPKMNEVYKRYVAQVGEDPPQGHYIEGYGAVELIAKGIEDAGTTDGPALKDAMEKFKDVEVLTGPTTFDTEYHVSFNRPVAIEEIQNGKVKFVTKIQPSFVPEPK